MIGQHFAIYFSVHRKIIPEKAARLQATLHAAAKPYRCQKKREASPLFKIARVPVRLYDVTSVVVNANDSVM